MTDKAELGAVAKDLVGRLLAAADTAAVGIGAYRATGDGEVLARAMDRLGREVDRVATQAAAIAGNVDPAGACLADAAGDDAVAAKALDDAAGTTAGMLTTGASGEFERLLILVDRLRGTALRVRDEAEGAAASARRTESPRLPVAEPSVPIH